MATSTLPTNWTQADFEAWFTPIYTDLSEERVDYIYARTPDELELNVFEYLATGATSSPLPRGWTNPEFVEWITLLINDAWAEYYSQIISVTPPALLPAVKERINFDQPPPTTDLITGGSGQTPGVPGIPGLLPAGSTLTRASPAWYWEGSNYIRNWSALGGTAASPGVTPTNWSYSGAGGPFNNITRTIVGFGTEDGIPYMDIQYAGTPSASSGSGITCSYEVTNQIVAAPGQTWVGTVYLRLMAGTVPAAGFQQIVRDADAAGATLGASSLVARFPTGAALRSQPFVITRTLADPGTVRTSHTMNIPYANGVALNFTLRVGQPSHSTTSIPFVPQLYQVNNDTPRFPVDRTTAVPLGLHNEPAATNNLRNSSMVGAVPGSPGTLPTNWAQVGTLFGGGATVVATGTEDGIPYIDLRWQGNNTGTSYSLNFESNTNVVASFGQTWTGTVYLRLIAGSFAGILSSAVSPRLHLRSNTGTGNFAGDSFLAVTNAPLRTQRFAAIGGPNDPAMVGILPILYFGLTNGAAVDLTLRIGLPQLGQSAVVTSPIVTSTVAVTRAAEVFNAPVANGTYSIAVTRAAGVTIYPNQTSTAGKWLVPVDPSPVKSVAATVTTPFTASYSFMAATIPPGVTHSRASIGWVFGSSGVLTSFATNVPRFRYNPVTLVLEGLHNEAAATNQIRNSSATGAVNGTPGTPPTNWSPTGAGVFNGLSRTIVGTGIEDGIPYLDIAYAGTPTATGSISIMWEGNTQVVAVPGETWVGSVFLRLMAGGIPGGPPGGTAESYISQSMVERNTAGSSQFINRVLRQPTGAALRTQRYDHINVNSSPLMTRISHSLSMDYSLAVPVSVTLRIGLPQLVRIEAPASPIITDTVAVTRAADIVTVTQANLNPGFWSAIVKRASGTRTYPIDLTAGGNIAYVIPNDPSPVQSLKLEPTK